MKNPRLFGAGILVMLFWQSCQKPLVETREAIEFPSDFPPVQYQNPSNPFNAASIALGRKLFYDPNLSRSRTISCGSCHAQVHGFADHNLPVSFGIYGRKGQRNAPSLVNLAWMPRFMWDGGIRHLDVLSIAPFTDTTEMGMTLPAVLERVRENPEYESYFNQAYGTFDVDESRVLLPLSQFMLSIISDQSKYDRVRRSQDQFTPIEQKGYELFKTNCSTCHQEPLLTRNDFQRNGITNNGSELGRFRITQLPQDSFAFKVPTLRNVELTYPYMHNGRIRTLKEVLDAYNNADRSHAPNLPTFHLDENQKEALIAFLKTLTDYRMISNLNLSEPR